MRELFMDYFQAVIRYSIMFFTIAQLIVSLYTVHGRTSSLSLTENLELEKELKSLNKPYAMTIKTQYGDVYDCVELYKQSAFDHPLLKHHKIQMWPSSADEAKGVINATNAGSSSSKSIAIGLKELACPIGTVPIRRTTKEELSRAKASFREQFQRSISEAGPAPRLMFAGLSTVPKNSTSYLEAGGFVSIHNPEVGLGQLSGSVISIEDGPSEQFSCIRVGWMVNINQFGDNHTRLYTIWGQAIDGVMHGCYNTYCSGFVQVDTKIPLSMVLEPISIPHGTQYYIKLSVSLDKSSGNWWLTYGDSDTRIGYWSSSIFTNLKDGAEVLRWGGQVYSSVPSMPVMGSGEMDDYFGSHYRQVSLRYESGSSLNGTLDAPLEILQSRCYKAGNNAYKGEYWGYSFWFGGTGGDIQQCL